MTVKRRRRRRRPTLSEDQIDFTDAALELARTLRTRARVSGFSVGVQAIAMMFTTGELVGQFLKTVAPVVSPRRGSAFTTAYLSAIRELVDIRFDLDQFLSDEADDEADDDPPEGA